MLDQTRGSDYTIWCVAALLYAIDAARLLSLRQLLFVEAGRGCLAAVFSASPFTLGGRVLAFAPLLRPDRGVFVAPWGQEWAPTAVLAGAIEALERHRAALAGARALAWAGFLVLFVVGPGLTLLLGPNAGVAYTALVLYPAVAAAIGWLWWRRRHVGASAAHALRVSVEMLICPAFLPNLVRKLTAAHPLTIDGAQLLAAVTIGEVRGEVLPRLVERAEEIIETAGADSTEAEALRQYLVTLRRQP